MSGDNMYKFKVKVAPAWYKNGVPTIYNSTQIAEWEANCDPKLLRKLENQKGMSAEEIKILDGINYESAERQFQEIMEGYKDNGITYDVAEKIKRQRSKR